MKIDISHEQKKTLHEVLSWLKNQHKPFLTIGGYAGTGKTTLTALMRKLLREMAPKMTVAFCSYTGKATRVLEATLSLYGVKEKNDSITTIHSLIYAPVLTSKGTISGWKLKDSIKADLIVVDEASMVDEKIWHDLLSFRVPILAIGDHGQLPPIHGSFSLMKSPDIKLTTIHRQAQGHPIIKLSIMARENGMIPIGLFGNGVQKISRYDSGGGQIIEDILQSAQKDTLILAGYNATRVRLNKHVRASREYYEMRPQTGDIVVCLRNNWDKGIYNGMTGVIKRIIPHQEADTATVRWYETEIMMDDDSLYSGMISAQQFNAPSTLKDEVFSGKDRGDLFDFGYALTVHKAQGSQAQRVLLFEERFPKMDDETWRRWLYTGITRAEENLVIVGS